MVGRKRSISTALPFSLSSPARGTRTHTQGQTGQTGEGQGRKSRLLVETLAPLRKKTIRQLNQTVSRLKISAPSLHNPLHQGTQFPRFLPVIKSNLTSTEF